MSRSIVAITPDGSEKLYRSITEFRLEYSVSSPTVDRALKSGLPIKRGKLKGWQFRYFNLKKEALDTP